MDFPEREEILSGVKANRHYINTNDYFSPLIRKGDLVGFFEELKPYRKELVDMYDFRPPHFALHPDVPLEKVYTNNGYRFIIKMNVDLYKGNIRRNIGRKNFVIDFSYISERRILFMTFYREEDWLQNFYPHSQTKACKA